MAQYTKGIDSRGIFFLAIANGIQCSPVFRTIDQALDYGAFIEKGGQTTSLSNFMERRKIYE